MTDSPNIKEKKHINSVSPIIAGIAGVVVGGAAVAASMAMSNKKNRDHVKAGFGKVKDQATGYMDDIKKQTQDKKTEVKDKVIEEIKKI